MKGAKTFALVATAIWLSSLAAGDDADKERHSRLGIGIWLGPEGGTYGWNPQYPYYPPVAKRPEAALEQALLPSAPTKSRFSILWPPDTVLQPPLFLFPGKLGLGVAVGSPYDLFYASGGYYLFWGGRWFHSPLCCGPWTVVDRKKLPAALQKNDLKTIHKLRDDEFRRYWEDREHYAGKCFRPIKERKGPVILKER